MSISTWIFSSAIIPHLIVVRLYGESGSVKFKMLLISHTTPIANALTDSTHGGYHMLANCK